MTARGIQGKELAAQMEVQASTVSEWRNNRQQPTEENLIRIAAILGVHPEQLVPNPNAADQAVGAFLGSDRTAYLAGVSHEVKMLLEYALGRQTALTEALSAQDAGVAEIRKELLEAAELPVNPPVKKSRAVGGQRSG